MVFEKCLHLISELINFFLRIYTVNGVEMRGGSKESFRKGGSRFKLGPLDSTYRAPRGISSAARGLAAASGHHRKCLSGCDTALRPAAVREV